MNAELDKKLCEKYPKIFRDRNASMMESCMHWGIEVGDGWYDIIDSMCEAMSSTYSTSVRLTRRQAGKLGIEPWSYNNSKPNWWWPGDHRVRKYTGKHRHPMPPYWPNWKEVLTYPPKFAWQMLKYLLKPTSTVYSLNVDQPQVIADQVKEKFGTLRFYYHCQFDDKFEALLTMKEPWWAKKGTEAHDVAMRYGSHMDGIVGYAETLSARTCEVTGQKGELHSSGGWYRVLNREYAKTLDRNYIPVADIKQDGQRDPQTP